MVVAAVGVASTFGRRTTAAAAGAIALMATAAVATVAEAPLAVDELDSRFAADRPLAAASATAAAILILVVAVTIAVRARRSLVRGAVADAPPAIDGSSPGRPLRIAIRDAGANVGPWLGVAGVVVLAAVALAVAAPSPPSATSAVADSVRQGLGWGTLEDGTLRLDGTEPPLPVVVDAVAPGHAPWATPLAGAVAVAVVAVLVARHGSPRVALAAAALAAMGLVGGRVDLAGALAAATTALALLAGDPSRRTAGRAAVAGALFGAVCLCLPSANLLLPVVVGALVLHPRTGDVTVGHGLAGLAAAVAVIAPWQRWLLERFSTWAPAADAQVPASSVVGIIVVVLVVGATLLWGARHQPRPA